MAVKDIYAGIIERGLYQFGAKNPGGVLSGTLRKHVTTSTTPLIVEVSSGVYKIAGGAVATRGATPHARSVSGVKPQVLCLGGTSGGAQPCGIIGTPGGTRR